MHHLQRIGIAVSRAKYFITTSDVKYLKDHQAMQIKEFILNEGRSKYEANFSQQLKMF